MEEREREREVKRERERERGKERAREREREIGGGEGVGPRAGCHGCHVALFTFLYNAALIMAFEITQ